MYFLQANIFDACVGTLSLLRFADDKFGGSLDSFNDMVREHFIVMNRYFLIFFSFRTVPIAVRRYVGLSSSSDY